MQEKFQGQIESIQLLRVIASVGVALFHIQCFYNTGLYLQFGVHLFYIISAFLMMYTTQKEPKAHFITRRLLRFVPLYWLLTFATYAAMKIVPGLIGGGTTDINSFVCSLLFIPYTRDGLRGTGVIRPIVGPGWTLNYEVLFTVIFAIAMKISHKHRGLFTGCVLAVLAACGAIFEIHSAPLFFWTRDYWVDFIAGIVVFSILKKLYFAFFSRKIRFCYTTVAITAMIIMCWGGFGEPRWLIFAGLGSLAVISFLLGLKDVHIPNVFLKAGNISFSFYLIHYYVIIFVGKVFDLDSFGIPAVIGTVLVFAVTYVLAYISYMVVEVKFTGVLKEKMRI